jgi:hypothetical protein
MRNRISPAAAPAAVTVADSAVLARLAESAHAALSVQSAIRERR